MERQSKIKRQVTLEMERILYVSNFKRNMAIFWFQAQALTFYLIFL